MTGGLVWWVSKRAENKAIGFCWSFDSCNINFVIVNRFVMVICTTPQLLLLLCCGCRLLGHTYGQGWDLPRRLLDLLRLDGRTDGWIDGWTGTGGSMGWQWGTHSWGMKYFCITQTIASKKFQILSVPPPRFYQPASQWRGLSLPLHVPLSMLLHRSSGREGERQKLVQRPQSESEQLF